jgi:phosphatidylglycerol:prolipoprotein diacylglycerol transferase
MRFPTDDRARAVLMLDRIGHKRDEELAIQYAYGKVSWQDIEPSLHSETARGQAIPWAEIRPRLEAWDSLKEEVPFRHPSQLYEAFGEGLLVGLVLLGVYLATRRRPLRPWAYGGLFALGYGVVRFGIEFLRQPDAQFRDVDDELGTVLLGMTMGQTLCAAMIAVGGFFVVRGLFGHRPASNAEGAAA